MNCNLQKSASICQQSLTALLMCQKKYYLPQMQSFLQNPDHWMLHKSNKILKHAPGDTSTVVALTIDGHKMVAKRYNIKGLWHRLKLWLRKSKAAVSWENAHLLQAVGIPSVEPIAMLEKRYGPLRREAYFLYKHIAGTTAKDYFDDTNIPDDKKKIVIEKIIRLLTKLKTAHIRHKDPQPVNILINKHQPILLDLDHLKSYRPRSRRFKKIEKRDIYHFVNHYSLQNWVRQQCLQILKTMEPS